MELLVAALVSAFVEWAKRAGETSHAGTVLVLALASVFAASIYTGLVAVGWWTAIWHILVEAAGIYALFIQYLPKSQSAIAE